MRVPGLDSIEAARLIREEPHLSHIPIFVMTACASPDVRARVQAGDLMGPLLKALDLEALPRQIADGVLPPARHLAIPSQRRPALTAAHPAGSLRARSPLPFRSRLTLRCAGPSALFPRLSLTRALRRK